MTADAQVLMKRGATVTDPATSSAREDAQRWQDRYVDLFDRCIETRKAFQDAIAAESDPIRKRVLYDALQLFLDPDGECDRSPEPL